MGLFRLGGRFFRSIGLMRGQGSSLPLLKQNPPQPAMPGNRAWGRHAALAFGRFWGIHDRHAIEI
jgi:hypothetical protein